MIFYFTDYFTYQLLEILHDCFILLLLIYRHIYSFINIHFTYLFNHALIYHADELKIQKIDLSI